MRHIKRGLLNNAAQVLQCFWNTSFLIHLIKTDITITDILLIMLNVSTVTFCWHTPASHLL